jgi:acetyl-CoA synthetase
MSSADSNVSRWIAEHGFATYAELHAFSVKQREEFLREAVSKLRLRFRIPFEHAVDLSRGVKNPLWFAGAKLNIVDGIFDDVPERTAILFGGETAPGATRLSLAELDTLSSRVAHGLANHGYSRGDAIAIDMPMTSTCVAIYLGVVRAGMAVVSIADSFAPAEIEARLQIAGARAIFTQDAIRRGGKRLPLYEKVTQAHAPRAIVVADDESSNSSLRAMDVPFKAFLGEAGVFTNVAADPSATINILFSSGTTGNPKAIPWTHSTAIRCALDGYVHQDIQAGDVVAWPTSVGWMMGPWLIFAALLNKATITLYDGAPQTPEFCRFVQDAGVTVLGVVPSLVRAWRSGRCVAGLNWNHIKLFSSTGEASNPDDMKWLMDTAGGKPVIEYCGGTEIGGAYVTSTVVQPNKPACFSAKAIGTEFVILDESGKESDEGEVFIVPPSIGLSTSLLKGDHEAAYFAGCPTGPHGEILRRHGDEMQVLPDGYYRALGRADDTMNLGGIKVSSVELERVMNRTPGVVETAAVAVSPNEGGPSELQVHAVVETQVWGDPAALQRELQSRLRTELNPLFKIARVHLRESLPRTASNKVMRRLLRTTSS